MSTFTVEWFCRSLGARSRAGGISQNLGRREPVRSPFLLTQKTNRVPSEGERGRRCRLPTTADFGVCTMCTLRAADRLELGSDRAGFGMFSGERRICRGWNAVRVPPRAQHDPSSEGFLL
jgi:hypothetical protein